MYYDILKASKVKAEVFPDYWTQLWGRKLSASMIKTLTGTLPLTFSTSEDKLRDWTIYGNSYEHTYSATGTLPLTFTTHTAGNADDWSISGNNNVGKNLLPSAVNGTYTSGRGTVICNNGVYTFKISAGTGSVSIIVPIPEFTIPVSVGQGGNGVLYFLNNKATSEIAIPFTYNGSSVMSNYTPLTINRVINDYGTTETKQCNGVQFFAANSVGDYEITISPMFITDGTAPDHYIPYQKGVGERTANKMPAPTNGVYSANRTTVTVTDGVYHIVQTEGSGSSSVYIDLPEFEVPDSGYINYLNSAAYANTTIVLRYNGASLSGGYALTPINRAVAIGSDYAGKKVNQIQIYTTGNVAMAFTIAPMITDSNTYTSYIPYGYEIPLTINNTPQTFYIGDSPLTAGQSISKTSTGVDISAQVGSNTISTTLYNKPEMSITGVDYVGVGEPTNDGWQIPLSVSNGTNTTTVNVPIDAPLTDGQTVTDTLTINTFEGENTISTTLYNKPTMEIKYK